jgi:hypothetical protein
LNAFLVNDDWQTGVCTAKPSELKPGVLKQIHIENLKMYKLAGINHILAELSQAV